MPITFVEKKLTDLARAAPLMLVYKILPKNDPSCI